jgi:uncharacterized integral membrane protein
MTDIKDVKYYTSSYLPQWTVWISHIVIAILFFTLGGLYLYSREHGKLNTDKIGQALAWIVIIFGILMITYHGDLLFMWKTSKEIQ